MNVRALSLLLATVGCATRPEPPRAGPPGPRVTAAQRALRFVDPRFQPLVRYLASEVDSGAFPGAVVAVGSVTEGASAPFFAAVGHYGMDRLRFVDTGTVYDLASLTKVVGLTTSIMQLHGEGKLDLDAPVQRYVPAFNGGGKARVTIRHLLTHSSGLPAWRPLFAEATTRATAFALVDTTPLAYEPGRGTVYSDLGAIVLTQVVEAVTRMRLDAYLDSAIFRPLGMSSTRFSPPLEWRDRIAPTERSLDGTIIQGTVHDENAWKLGGVSGHAGLFSSAPDLARFAAWLLNVRAGRQTAGDDSSSSMPRIPQAVVQAFTRRQSLVPGSSRALGWDTPSERSSAGTKLSDSAFGHTGFTGTSIWLDPERNLYIILLTNRVHPTRENSRIYRVRSRVADLAVDALSGTAAAPGSPHSPASTGP